MSKHKETFARPIALAVLRYLIPASLVVLSVLPLLLFQERLPDTLATHWGIDGEPNDAMSADVFMIFSLLLVGMAALGMSFSARGEGYISRAVAITAFPAALVAITVWLVVFANMDASSWTQARSQGMTHAFGLLGGAVAVAAGCWALARLFDAELPTNTVLPHADIKPGTRAVWVGTARAWWAIGIATAFPVIAVFITVNQGVGPAMFLALGGIPLLVFTSVRVIADRHGVRYILGAFGRPNRLIELRDIRSAQVVVVIPLQRGGWGYRGSLKLFGRASIVLRGGEGLELRLKDDRVLTITVDDAKQGAGVINALIARQTT